MKIKKQQIPICFDLDHTLIDTLRIRKDIFALTKPYGIQANKLSYAYRGAVRERYSPRKFVSLLELANSDQTELLKKISILLKATRQQYVYPGSPKMLARLKKRNPLYLVTHGDAHYQKLKLQQAGLAHFFNRIIVTPEITKEKILQKLYAQSRGSILLIDDSRRVHQTARCIEFPIIKIRKSYKDSEYFEELYERIIKTLKRIENTL